MSRRYLDPLSRLLSTRTRREVLAGLGLGAAGTAVAGHAAAQDEDEAACHARCNATVPPGPALGMCHAQCGLNAAQAAQARAQTTLTSEEQCHLHCNATVPPGRALAMCHIQCALAG
jgi:hypothetical protein